MQNIERVKENAFSDNDGAVTDKIAERNLREFLEEYKNNATKTAKNVEKKLSIIDFNADSVAYLLQLEHR